MGAARPLDGLSEYDLRHLVQHLCAAHRADDVHRLFRLEEGAEPGVRANAWFAAQESIGNVDGFLADVRLALDLTWREQDGAALAHGARFVLAASSARSVTSEAPAALVAAAVRADVQAPAAAIAQIARIADPGLAADSMLALAPHVSPLRRAELRVLAMNLADPAEQARALAGLAADAPPEEIHDLVAAAEALRPSWTDDELLAVLEALAPQLGEDESERLLGLARGTEQGTTRARALLTLAPQLSPALRREIADEAWQTARSDPNRFWRVQVLAHAVAALPDVARDAARDSVADEAIATLDKAYEVYRIEPLLPDDKLVPALRRAMTVDPGESGVEVLVRMAPRVPDAHLEELMGVASLITGPAEGIGTAIKAGYDRAVARMIAGLADRFTPELQGRALQLASELQPDARAVLVAALAPRLAPDLFALARELALLDEPSPGRCAALAALATNAGDEAESAKLAALATSEAVELADPERRGRAHLALAAAWSGPAAETARHAAAAAAGEVGDARVRTELLIEGGGDLLPVAHAASKHVEPTYERIRLLLQLLDAPVQAADRDAIAAEALELITQRAAEQWNPHPFEQLVDLAPRLPAWLAVAAAETALACERHLTHRRGGWDVLGPRLGAEGARVLVAGVRTLPPWRRSMVLEEVAPWVPDDSLADVVEQVGELDPDDAVPLLALYAPRFRPALVRQALQLCRRIGDAELALSTEVALVVAASASSASERLFSQVLAVRDSDRRARLLERMAPVLSAALLKRVAPLADAAEPGSSARLILFRLLAGRLPASELVGLLESAAEEEFSLAAVLQSAGPRLAAEAVDSAAELSMRIGDPVLRVNAVAALAPRLTPALRERLRGKANSLEPHAAVDILIAIVAGADGETKLDLIAAARAAADAVESESGTALAYLEIARHLDGQERAAALETALSRAFVVELAEEREPVVVDVLYELSDVDPERALALSEHLPEPARRRLVPYLITRLDAAAQDHVIRRLVAMYGYFASTIGKHFFPSDNPTNSLIAAFGVFAAGFLMCPLGGVIFGHIGDRIGRKAALTLSVLAMAIPTFLIGLLPGYHYLGIAAPILLVVLRMIQGLSVGGEYTTSIVFLVEGAPSKHQAFAGSWSGFGAVEALGGSAVAAAVTASFSLDFVNHWGWRLPFLIGLVVGLAGLYVREHIPESPRPAVGGDKPLARVAGLSDGMADHRAHCAAERRQRRGVLHDVCVLRDVHAIRRGPD